MATQLFGLVGYPLGHSFSRGYFTDKFARENIDAEYVNFELPDISEVCSIVDEHANLCGFNVTIPHKQAIMPLLDRIDPDAEAIGAVNVVRVEADGSLTGFNSDVYGFVESIRPMLGATHRRALVLGVGGASRAVVHGLRNLGLEVTQVSRRSGVGDLTYEQVTPEVIAAHTVIVNTTPLGMYPKVDACPDIPYRALTPGHVCFDLVYNPLQTLFLARAAEQGAQTSNGLEMLHLQADRSWQIWTD